MNKQSQRGDALLLALIAIFIFTLIGSVAVRSLKKTKDQYFITSEAKNLSVLSDGLSLYMKQNEQSYLKGYRISGVVNPSSPTIPELVGLNYLPSNITDHIRNAPLTLSVVISGGSKYGLVYTTQAILDSNGNPDNFFACSVSYQTSEDGMCTKNIGGLNFSLVSRNTTDQISVSGLQKGSLVIKVNY